MLPTFIVIGAAKAGTTSLYHYLRSHPDVFMPDHKELEFFSNRTWSLGPQWYERQFAGAGGALAVGEASPAYSAYPVAQDVPKRMAGLLPQVKLIYLVRHPIERMRSYYRQRVHRDNEARPFSEAMLSDPLYLEPSRYAMQIEHYLEHFPAQQLLVIQSERLESHRGETMRRIHAFIGVQGDVAAATSREFNRAEDKRVARPTAVRARRLPGYRRLVSVAPKQLRQAYRRIASQPIDVSTELRPEFRSQLEDMLRPDVRDLRTYLGADFDGWGIG